MPTDPSLSPPRRLTVVFVGLVCFALYVLAVNVATTQYVATHFGHHPLLGAPLVGHWYAPLAWFDWQHRYLATSRLFFLKVYMVYLGALVGGFLIYALVMGFRTRSSRTHPDSHGSAHFLKTEKSIRPTGLLPPNGQAGAGAYVGALVDRRGRTRYLRHEGPEHIGVFAPTRSGKRRQPESQNTSTRCQKQK